MMIMTTVSISIQCNPSFVFSFSVVSFAFSFSPFFFSPSRLRSRCPMCPAPLGRFRGIGWEVALSHRFLRAQAQVSLHGTAERGLVARGEAERGVKEAEKVMIAKRKERWTYSPIPR